MACITGLMEAVVFTLVVWHKNVKNGSSFTPPRFITDTVSNIIMGLSIQNKLA
jgi:hypothetical protein